MTSLERRENAYEAEFARREERRFRARERAVRALASWAAERLGKAGGEAETYAAKRPQRGSELRPPMLYVLRSRRSQWATLNGKRSPTEA
jgi:hypothetical protein